MGVHGLDPRYLNESTYATDMDSDHMVTVALDKLKAEILTFTHTVNQGYDSKKAQKILELVEVIPEHGSQPISPPPPPLELLVYAIKSILSPSVIYEQISDFVRLLTMVDFWRQRSMLEVDRAVIWDDYFATADNTGQMPYTQLTDDVKGILLNHQGDAAVWRKTFMIIVCKCLTTDLQRLWMSGRGTSFRTQWTVYFSIVTKHFVPHETNNRRPEGPRQPTNAQVDLTHAFQYQLSVQDLEMLIESMQECREFMAESLKNAEAWATSDFSKDEVFKTEDFQELVGVPTLDDILQLIAAYLESVIQLVQDADELIPKQLPA